MPAGGRGRRSPARAKQRLEVWKFGGAALADADAVRNALELVAAHPGPPVVVVSALSGVTDALLDGAHEAREGNTKLADAEAALLDTAEAAGRKLLYEATVGAEVTAAGILNDIQSLAVW